MAKYTLLKMTQLILSAMDSDEVTDIDATVEAKQVVDIIETTFDNIVSRMDFPENWDFFELTVGPGATKPTQMTIPTTVSKFDWLQYDARETGETIRKMEFVYPLDKVEFFDRMNGLDTANSNVYQYDYVVGSETFDVRGFNDQFPGYYTVLNDNTVIFDHFKTSVDTFLPANKTWGWGKIIPVFTRSNSAVQDLDDQNYSLLFNESMASAFIFLKQIQNGKADQNARRALLRTQNHKDRAPIPLFREANADNYGRSPRRPKGVRL